jgi:hypothetical protein
MSDEEHEFTGIVMCATCEEHEDECECDDFSADELDDCTECGETYYEGKHTGNS